VAGALPGAEFLALLEKTGFSQAEIVEKTGYKTAPETMGVTVRAVKPA
jgi:hypothetical protein